MIRGALSKVMWVGRATTMFFVALAIVVALVLAGASRSYAATSTFLVNSTTVPGNGVCDATECTLHEAINAANSNSNPTETDTITFNIPGTGPHTINMSQGLPTITQSVTIDGYSEPDSSANTLVNSSAGTNAKIAVVLQGGPSGVSGLTIVADNVTVKGLAIHTFNGFGIHVLKPNTNVHNLLIEGNFIGTDSGGTQDLGNAGGGVNLDQTIDTTVGGDAPAARNLISGNNSKGIQAFATSGTKVLGNLIGVQKDGKSALANSGDGVYLQNGGGTVGGALAGSANNIANNSGGGVVLFGSTLAPVLRNSIFLNGGLGIDLSNISANDHCDADTGPNSGQNFPEISSAQTTASGTTIQGSLDSIERKTYVVRFFGNPGGTDHHEGKKFLGKKSVRVLRDSNCEASFTFTTTKFTSSKSPGKHITATATDPAGNTSEFSAPRQVVLQ